MFLLLDILVLSIIVYCVISSAKKGFVYIAVEVVGFVAAIVVALSISTPLANYTYNNIIEDRIISSVTEFENNKTDVFNPVDAVWDNIPSFIKNSSLSAGVTKDTILEKMDTFTDETVSTAAKAASETVIKPVAVKLIGMIYSSILFVILIIIVKILARSVNKLFSFSIIGKANSLLGAIAGIAKGILIAAAFCFIISMLITFMNGKFLIFTTQSVKDSFAFGMLSKISPYFR